MPTVRHVVYFWLRDPASRADRDRLVAGLRGLAAIEQVQSLHVGTAAATGKREVVDASFDVAEFMTFVSVADQEAYQAHPLHLAFVEECGDLWSRVQVYDSEDVA